MKITSSWDDGCFDDVRISALMLKHNIPTVFYWPVNWHSLAYSKGYEPLPFGNAQAIAGMHEVGAHGVTHRYLTEIDTDQSKDEIVDSKAMLERLFNQTVTKFAPPRGYLDDELTEFCESVYDDIRLTKGENLVHVHHNSGANDNQPWREVAEDKLKQGLDIEIWGHSHELSRFNLWGELENFLGQL